MVAQRQRGMARPRFAAPSGHAARGRQRMHSQLGQSSGGELVAMGGPHRPPQSAREPQRGCCKALHTLRQLSAGGDGKANRLGRGHRYLGRRHWDDQVEATVLEIGETRWQHVAQFRAGLADHGTSFPSPGAMQVADRSGASAARTPHAGRRRASTESSLTSRSL